MDEFNEWQENWNDGDTYSAPVDVSKISDVPMSFFIGSIDVVCPSSVAKSYIKKMTTQTTIIDVNWEGHFYFAESANDPWFMKNLL